MPSKDVLDNYSEIFESAYDKIEENFKEYKNLITKMNLFLRRKIPEDFQVIENVEGEMIKPQEGKYVYAYLQQTQEEFMEIQTDISSKLDAVFPVVKDINSISAVGTETFQKTENVVKEGEQARQVVNIQSQPPKKPLFSGWFSRNPPQSNLPKSIEDFHIRSENWKNEIMNVPNIFGKFVTYHHYGVNRQFIFEGDGMAMYLETEINYLNTRTEQNISKIIKRAMHLDEKEFIKQLTEIYEGTQRTQAQLEQAQIMAGQGSSDNEG